MNAQKVYREIMECRTTKELNHVMTKHQDAIIANKWLHEIVKDAIRRISVIKQAKKLYA